MFRRESIQFLRIHHIIFFTLIVIVSWIFVINNKLYNVDEQHVELVKPSMKYEKTKVSQSMELEEINESGRALKCSFSFSSYLVKMNVGRAKSKFKKKRLPGTKFKLQSQKKILHLFALSITSSLRYYSFISSAVHLPPVLYFSCNKSAYNSSLRALVVINLQCRKSLQFFLVISNVGRFRGVVKDILLDLQLSLLGRRDCV